MTHIEKVFFSTFYRIILENIFGPGIHTDTHTNQREDKGFFHYFQRDLW